MRGAIVLGLAAVCAVAACGESKKKEGPAPTSTPASSGVTLDPEEAPPRTRPTDPPVVSTGSGGGIDGATIEATQVWADGTVLFGGRKCPKSRYGTLPVAEVTALLDELERAGYLHAPTDAELAEGKMGHRPACCDCVSSGAYATRGDKSMSLVDEGCGTTRPAELDKAQKIIRRAIGSNPCR
jgi:hypothetical protein